MSVVVVLVDPCVTVGNKQLYTISVNLGPKHSMAKCATECDISHTVHGGGQYCNSWSYSPSGKCQLYIEKGNGNVHSGSNGCGGISMFSDT